MTDRQSADVGGLDAVFVDVEGGTGFDFATGAAAGVCCLLPCSSWAAMTLRMSLNA